MGYPTDYPHILAATDFSELGDLALRRGAKMALETGARFTALHVLAAAVQPSPLIAHYEISTSRARIRAAKGAAIDALRERLPSELQGRENVSLVVRHGDPAEEILHVDVDLGPDLIVLATHGRRGWKKWVMGSVAERVLQLATADVLAIREREPSAVVTVGDPAPDVPPT